MREKAGLALSGPSAAWGVYLIISSSFVKQAWDFSASLLGLARLKFFVSIFLLCIVILFFSVVVIKGLSKRQRWDIFLTLFFLFLFSQFLPYFVEKLHILQFSFLGWLCARNLNVKSGFPELILPVFLVATISLADEVFQAFLPYRVADLRDVTLNLGSGLCGIYLRALLDKE